MFLSTHGSFLNHEGPPVPEFPANQKVRAALKRMDPNLDVRFMHRFGGRLAVVEKCHYTPFADRSEMPDWRVIMVMTSEDGGPRQIEMADIHRMRQAKLESWGDRLKMQREHNHRLDMQMEARSVLREEDFFADWQNTAVYDTRSIRNGSSNQYICEHGFRNVKCPLCRPDKKQKFLMGAKSGEANTGHDSVDLRDHPELLERLRQATESLRVAEEQQRGNMARARF